VSPFKPEEKEMARTLFAAFFMHGMIIGNSMTEYSQAAKIDHAFYLADQFIEKAEKPRA
jgi:hypothetical protein